MSIGNAESATVRRCGAQRGSLKIGSKAEQKEVRGLGENLLVTIW